MPKSRSLERIPVEIRSKYEIYEWRHAAAVLQNDFPSEWDDIKRVLLEFRLLRSEIEASGGRKTKIADRLDKPLYSLAWVEKRFNTSFLIDEEKVDSPTHKVDCYKNRVALEVEWNNKDPFYDRDLNNFRLLFELRAISVGVIITRCDELAEIFKRLGVYKSYGQSTTHMSKLLPRIDGGGGGGCPILVFGICATLYENDRPDVPEGTSTSSLEEDDDTA
jgi:hypothetical protein